jgi:hypothetical protein
MRLMSGCLAVTIVVLLAVVVRDSGQRRAPGGEAPIPIERLPPRQPHDPKARWTVTEHRSTHHVLVAHVETDRLDDARAIAEQLTAPLQDRYAEVLIYFHRPGRPDILPPRRVQWTPRDGYAEAVYDVNR